MRDSSLEYLHRQFTTALQAHAYLGFSASSKKLEKTTTKQIHLQQVFTIARQQIDTILKDTQNQDREAKITQLRDLETVGKLHYQRYLKATRRWSRSFLKALAINTPAFLKRFLPQYVSQVVKAEQGTKQNYHNYQKALEQHILRLKTTPFIQNREEIKVPVLLSEELPFITKTPLSLPLITTIREDEPFPPSFKLKKQIEIPLLSTEEIEKQQQSNLTTAYHEIEQHVSYLRQFNEVPFSLKRYKSILQILVSQLQKIVQLDPLQANQTLNDLGLSTTAQQALTTSEMRNALIIHDDQKLLSLLNSTEWQASFQEALTQQECTVTFGVRHMTQPPTLCLLGITEPQLQSYRGQINLNFNRLEQAQKDLSFLLNYLQTYPQCRPYQIAFSFYPDVSLTPELSNLLLSLRNKTSELQLNHLSDINFRAAGFTAEEEHRFVQQLDFFSCPHLNSITLSDHSKQAWTSLDFSRLLEFCPQMELLKACYHSSSSPQDISLPSTLLQITEADLSIFPVEQVPFLLNQLTHLTHLNLRGLKISDFELQQWIENGNFDQLTSLNLENCPLTTDSLFTLIFLFHLAHLTLPDLPQGKINLNHLPTFDNPFKIHTFYTSSQAIEAAQLYTGPKIWSAIFQIPLARKGIKTIFPPQQTVLDPKSVAYWLYDDDYRYLTPQTAIKTIIGDNAPFTDKTLVEFVKKFPQVESLSLYQCSHITSEGVIQLLQACPHIRKLDLTSCSQITAHLFHKQDLTLFKSLTQLIISDTKIPSVIINRYQKDLKFMHFEESVWRITNDQLTDENALESLLKSKDLHLFKRLDLTNCTNLTNSMLGKLLNRCNIAIWTSSAQDCFNPQRLNLAVLNLTGCSQINDKAFVDRIQEGKIEPKLLGNLARIVTGETHISPVLQNVYPDVIFQEKDETPTLSIDPKAQLQACLAYYETTDAKEKKNQARSFLHNQAAVHLFSTHCQDRASVNKMIHHPLDPQAPEFCDLTLFFSALDGTEKGKYETHRDRLRCIPSPYFINGLRAGGILSKDSTLHYINPNAYPETIQVMLDLVEGTKTIQSIDWKIASQTAELVGPHIFKLPSSYYQALLHHIHSQFDLNQADEMLFSAQMLNDLEGKKQYENILLFYLEDNELNEEDFRQIANIARVHQLSHLLKKIETIEHNLTAKLIEQERRNYSHLAP